MQSLQRYPISNESCVIDGFSTLSFRPKGGICFWGSATLSPLGSQVFPGTVGRGNQSHFFLAAPLVDLGLMSQRVVHVLEGLVINQPVDGISLCEAIGFCCLVLQYASHEKAGHTDVQSSAFAG